jgi:hypothetical protein
MKTKRTKITRSKKRQNTIHREHVIQNTWKVYIRPFVVILSLSVALSIFLSACTVHAVDSQGGQEMLTMTGKLRLVGNEPFTHLVITTEDGKDYLIQGDLEKELRALQYQMVTVTGENLPPKDEFKYRIDVSEYNTIDSAQ